MGAITQGPRGVNSLLLFINRSVILGSLALYTKSYLLLPTSLFMERSLLFSRPTFAFYGTFSGK